MHQDSCPGHKKSPPVTYSYTIYIYIYTIPRAEIESASTSAITYRYRAERRALSKGGHDVVAGVHHERRRGGGGVEAVELRLDL